MTPARWVFVVLGALVFAFVLVSLRGAGQNDVRPSVDEAVEGLPVEKLRAWFDGLGEPIAVQRCDPQPADPSGPIVLALAPLVVQTVSFSALADPGDVGDPAGWAFGRLRVVEGSATVRYTPSGEHASDPKELGKGDSLKLAVQSRGGELSVHSAGAARIEIDLAP